jgi:hypothetical protein
MEIGTSLTRDNWKDLIRSHLKDLDWHGVVDDVRPFVELGFDLNLLTPVNFQQLPSK